MSAPRVVGLTGSSGVATARAWLGAIARAAGARVTTVSRDGAIAPDARISAGPIERAIAAIGAAAAADVVIVEVTAAELSRGAARGLRPSVAVVTRFDDERAADGQSAEAHLAALAQIALAVPAGGAVVVGEDGGVADLIAEIAPAGAEVRRFGLAGELDAPPGPGLFVERSAWDGARGRTEVALAPGAPPTLGPTLSVHGWGEADVLGALAAASAALALGWGADAVARGLAAPATARRVIAASPLVVVDEARTTSERERLARDLAARGAAQVRWVDAAVPLAARAAAIARAVALAGPGDAVAIAGYGDARTLEDGPRTVAWSDAREARRALAAEAP